MTVTTLLLILLVVMLVGAIPAWPYSRGWGYGPGGFVMAILLALLVLKLLHKI
jgi:Protein of unknown function (DUF3309)